LIAASDGGIGQTLLQRGENLHTLDGVDTEIRIQLHIRFEHFRRIPGFFSDYCQQLLLKIRIRCR